MITIRNSLIALALSAALPLAMTAQTSGSAAAKPKKETQAQLQKEAKISLAAATATAQQEVPAGKMTAHELEREKGKLIYSLEFKVPGKSGIDEVNIDAMTGLLVDKSHESPATEAKERAKPKPKP